MVNIGITSLVKDDQNNKQEFEISNIIVHPKYGQNSFKNDIAIIKLKVIKYA